MKTRKIILFIVVLLGTLLFSSKVNASIQSRNVVISSPKNESTYKIGDTVNLNYTVYDVYMNLFNNEIYTNPVLRVFYKGRTGTKQIYEKNLGCIWEKITDHQRGDFITGSLPMDLKGEGGIIVVDITCYPRNTRTLAIDERISEAAYASKTICFYIYSDLDASASFVNSSVNKKVGDSSFINTFRTSSDGKVTYSSSNTSVATVNSSTGEVTMHKAGTATITATVGRSYVYKQTSASYTVNVTGVKEENKNENKIEENKIENTQVNTTTNEIANNTTAVNGNTTVNNSSKPKTKSSPTLKFASSSINKKTTDGSFTNRLNATTDGKITYKSNNTSVATVNSSTGAVIIKGVGTATITASSSETEKYKVGSASYKLTVTKPITSSSSTSTGSSSNSTPTTVSKVSPTLNFASYSINKTTADAPFTNKLSTNTDGKLVYRTDNSKVAIVDSTGKVTIKGVGTADISVVTTETTKYKSVRKSYTLTVTNPAKLNPTMSFASSEITKSVTNSSFTNKLTTNSNGKVTYSSSLTSVATIDANGKVTIKGGGSTLIKATVAETSKYNAKTISYFLTVKKLEPTASFQYNNISRKVGQNFTNVVTTNSNGTIDYKSSDASVAGVDSNGYVYVNGKGTATITATISATSKYYEKRVSYTVTVK